MHRYIKYAAVFAVLIAVILISCGRDAPEETDAQTSAAEETAVVSEADTEIEAPPDDPVETVGEPIYDPSPSYLTAEGINGVAPGKNIIIFLIDRFDVKYYERVLRADSGFFDGLDGFTYFSDNTSLYTATYPAICWLVTGIRQDFTLTASEYFANAYNTSDFLYDLYKNDYSIKLYTDTYHAYRDDTPLLKYFANAVRSDGGSQNVYVSDDVRLWEYISGGLTVETGHQNGYIFYHMNGCHTPVTMGKDCQPSDSASVADAAMGCFKIIYKYIEELKRLGLYEDATIVITGDHSAGGTDDDAAPVNGTALLVKPAGAYGTPLAESRAQVSDVNLIPTLIKSAGICSKTEYVPGYFDISEDEIGDRTLVRFQYGEGGSNDCTHYKIVGPWRDKQNWEVVYRINYKNLYR